MTTRLGALATILASEDPFGLVNYGQLKANNDYFTIAGADLASATTIDITSEFHKVTGTVTITTITDLLGAIEGQPLRLWFTGAVTIQNGSGNILTKTGANRFIRPNEIVEFAFNGTNWQEKGGMPPGTELARTLISSNVSATGTTPATGATIATLPSITFDGSTEVAIDLKAPGSDTPGIVSTNLWVEVMEGSTDLGKVAEIASPANVVLVSPLTTTPLILTPSAGAHVYKFVLWVDSGTGFVLSGAGGATTLINAIARVVKT